MGSSFSKQPKTWDVYSPGDELVSQEARPEDCYPNTQIQPSLHDHAPHSIVDDQNNQKQKKTTCACSLSLMARSLAQDQEVH